MPHYCEIAACRAMLLFPHYTVFALDDSRSVATCPHCAKKTRAEIKAAPDRRAA